MVGVGGKKITKRPPPPAPLPHPSQFICMGTRVKTGQGGPKYWFICMGGMGQDTTCQIIHMSHIQWIMWVDLVVVSSSPCYCPLRRKGEVTISVEDWGITYVTKWENMGHHHSPPLLFNKLKTKSNQIGHMPKVAQKISM